MGRRVDCAYLLRVKSARLVVGGRGEQMVDRWSVRVTVDSDTPHWTQRYVDREWAWQEEAEIEPDPGFSWSGPWEPFASSSAVAGKSENWEGGGGRGSIETISKTHWRRPMMKVPE